jgi:hypothetical protein
MIADNFKQPGNLKFDPNEDFEISSPVRLKSDSSEDLEISGTPLPRISEPVPTEDLESSVPHVPLPTISSKAGPDDELVISAIYIAWLYFALFYQIAIGTVIGLGGASYTFRKVNIVLYIVSLLFGGAGVTVVLLGFSFYYPRYNEDLHAVSETFRCYFFQVFIFFCLLYFPWPHFFNLNAQCFVSNMKDSYIWVIFAASVTCFSVFALWYLSLFRIIRSLFEEVDDKYRIKITSNFLGSEVVKENDVKERVENAMSKFEDIYPAVKVITSLLKLSFALASVEFVISTVLLFHLIFRTCSYDYLTIAMTTSSTLPFSFVAILIVCFNNAVTKIEADLGIKSDLAVEIFHYRADWRLLLSISSAVVSYLYKNFIR